MTPQHMVCLCPPERVTIEQDWSGSGTDAIQAWSTKPHNTHISATY